MSSWEKVHTEKYGGDDHCLYGAGEILGIARL